MGESVHSSLIELRREIDELDRCILDLFAKRFAVTDEVGLFKKQHNLPAQDVDREAAQHARLAELAQARGLDAAFVRDYLSAMTACVVQRHSALK